MSDKAAFITGSTFLIDGGATASYFYGPLAPKKVVSIRGRKSEKVLSLLINISLLFSLTACGNNATADMIENTTLSSNVVSEKDLGSQGMEQSERQQQTEDSDMNNTTILVAYFSRTGENYNVGNIEKAIPILWLI